MRYHKSIFNTLNYCLVINDKQAKKVIKKFNLHKESLINNMTYDAYTYYDSDNKIIAIRIVNNELSLINLISLIIHEVTHVKQFVMEQLNEHKPSDEFEAYLMQEITNNLLTDCFNKLKIKL